MNNDELQFFGPGLNYNSASAVSSHLELHRSHQPSIISFLKKRTMEKPGNIPVSEKGQLEQGTAEVVPPCNPLFVVSGVSDLDAIMSDYSERTCSEANGSERCSVPAESLPSEVSSEFSGMELSVNDLHGSTVQVVFLTDPTVQATSPAEPPSQNLMKAKRKIKESTVWKHFKKHSVLSTSECNYCHKHFHTLNATNVKRHLRVCKPEACKEVEDADNPRKDSDKRNFKPLTVAAFSKFYPRNHTKQLLFRKKIALLAGATTMAKRILQTTEFKDCINVADPKLRVPNYDTVNADIKKAVATCRNQIRCLIKPVQRMTFSSDIWTKKGQTSSFLCIIATFFHQRLNKKVQIVLSVRKFESVSHTSNDIIRETKHVLSKFDIQPEQVWRSMTDGASNMISSHRWRSRLFEQKISTTEINEESNEYGSESCLSDSEILREIAATSEFQKLPDVEYEVDDPLQHTKLNDSYRRLGCFIHTLLRCLCVCESSEKSQKIQPLINKVKLLVGKFKKSHVLTESLIKNSGIGLVSFSETRWNYIFNVFTRILRVREGLVQTLKENQKTNEKYILTDNEWEDVKKITDFLQPFSTYTSSNAKEKEAISSEVIVTIVQLYSHLDKYDSDALLDHFSAAIKQKMKDKFSQWFYDKPDQPVEGTYLSATLLDPRYRIILPDQQKILAKNCIIKEYTTLMSNSATLSTPTSFPEPAIYLQKPCRFPLLSGIKSSVLRERSEVPQTGLEQLNVEVDKYLSCQEYDELDEGCDVFLFWIGLQTQFPLLAPIALDYLSIPSSTSNVECMFSTAGILSSNCRYNLNWENLEDEVLLSRNKHLLDEFSKLDELEHVK